MKPAILYLINKLTFDVYHDVYRSHTNANFTPAMLIWSSLLHYSYIGDSVSTVELVCTLMHVDVLSLYLRHTSSSSKHYKRLVSARLSRFDRHYWEECACEDYSTLASISARNLSISELPADWIGETSTLSWQCRLVDATEQSPCVVIVPVQPGRCNAGVVLCSTHTFFVRHEIRGRT